MRWNPRSSMLANAFRRARSALLLMMALALVAAAGPRVRLTQKFSPGDTLRYRIEARTTTTATTTTPIVNPEGGSQSKQVMDLLVRLDVLDIPPAPGPGLAPVRVRATFEKSSAKLDSDALDLEQSSLEDAYHRIEGHSIEFTMAPDAQLSQFKGLEDLLPSGSAAEPVLSWLTSLLSAGGLPRGGVAIGQKWNSQRALSGVPLTGLTWRTQSTHLRDEPCHRSDAAGAPGRPAASPGDACAIILTRLEIFRRGSAHGDATPEDYLRNGLRTSGTWTGSGESLDAISLDTGWLVSSTQTSSQDMDYVITSAATGSAIHHHASVHTQSQITLVPASR
jgi:hypothetical protein